MGETLQRIRDLVANGAVRVSAHGYDELAMDDIMIDDIVGGVDDGIVVEDYPGYAKGPCVLVLLRDPAGQPIHVVWGIPPRQVIASRCRHSLPTISGSMGGGFHREEKVSARPTTKLVHEGDYVAEVAVELLESDESWAPFLSLADAQKLDAVREALRRGDVKAANKYARVFRLVPVAV